MKHIRKFLRSVKAKVTSLIAPVDTGEVTAEAVAFAIEAANSARIAEGVDTWDRDQLPYSTHVGNAQNCVLARLFNFDCQVRPGMFASESVESDGADGWGVRVPAKHKKAAEALAKALGTKIEYSGYEGAPDLDTYGVKLPASVARIALEFDRHENSTFSANEGEVSALPRKFVSHYDALGGEHSDYELARHFAA